MGENYYQVVQQGIKDGVKKGCLEANVDSIMNVMETLDLSFEKVVEALKIEEEDIPKIKERMKEKILK